MEFPYSVNSVLNSKFNTIKMRKDILKLCLMVAIAGLYGCHNKPGSTDESVWVKIDTVKNSTFKETLQFPAKIKASQEVNIAFKISGTMQRLYVKEGEYFKRGALIAQMDSRDYELQLQAAESEYNGVKAEAERVFALYADSVATASEYDKARYGLKQITAKYENAKNQLADTKIYAPFDGIVKTCLLDPPTIVGAGMPIMTILSSNMPEVEIYVPASTYYRIEDVESYSVKFDFHDEPIALQKISVSPSANSNQLYAVRLALPLAAKVKQTAGMSAMVDITFNRNNSGEVSVPASALFSQNDENYVWIYKDGDVQPRKVVVSSLHLDGSATITDGLSPGEIIVTAGAKSLKSNSKVKPLQPKNATNIGGIL